MDERDIHLLVPTQIDGCIAFRGQHIPHLCFTKALLVLQRIVIIRVHLDREVIGRIDELQQQREVVSEYIVHFLAHEFIHIDLEKILQAIAGMGAIGHFGRIFLHIGHHPCFSDVLIVRRNIVIPFLYGMSSPYLMEKLCPKFKRIEHKSMIGDW